MPELSSKTLPLSGTQCIGPCWVAGRTRSLRTVAVCVAIYLMPVGPPNKKAARAQNNPKSSSECCYSASDTVYDSVTEFWFSFPEPFACPFSAVDQNALHHRPPLPSTFHTTTSKCFLSNQRTCGGKERVNRFYWGARRRVFNGQFI